MSVISNTKWRVHANNYDGDLIINEDNTGAMSGIIFGNVLESIQLTGDSISFVRRIRLDYVQLYSGTILNPGQGGSDAWWTMMGLFTEEQGGKVSMPYLWSTDRLLIPG